MTSLITHESISLSGPPVVRPGGNLPFVGRCTREPGVHEATIRAIEVVGPEAEPFVFSVTLAVNSAGLFFGGIVVPGNAPNWQYRLEVTCAYPSAMPNRGELGSPITVDGPWITTTSSTPLQAATHVDPAPPAVPRPGDANLTG
jgi:hypothetical protein